MRVNSFGEQTIETDADWENCARLQEQGYGACYAQVQKDEPGADGKYERDGEIWFAEVHENESGDTVCFVKGFQTEEALRRFIEKNAPSLEIQGE